MTGSTQHSVEIRVLIAIELLLNMDYYKDLHDSMDLYDVSIAVTEAVQDSVTRYKSSSVWLLMPAATVMKRNIVSVYPPVNGHQDRTFSILNKSFSPRVPGTYDEINILWSGYIARNSSQTWTPSHFVPLIPIPIPKVIPTTFAEHHPSSLNMEKLEIVEAHKGGIRLHLGGYIYVRNDSSQDKT